ncbi:MAG: molybdopterin-dependent oxidoreductase [Planctomycetota bacterium]|nr:molybdopterin-dependent oxidoreductase [Planctomycetota bacterium]MDA1250187.1 molybdopterin-dependent oxidoreductase [Planctomycetota bacterium]
MIAADESATQTVSLTIDGKSIEVPLGTSIIDAAREAGIEIPVLCHSDRMDPVGVCRMCVVDVGERVLAASCVRECADGMTVETASPKVEKHRRVLTELLLAEHPVPCARERTSQDCELEALGRQYGLLPDEGRFSEEGETLLTEPLRFPASSAALHEHDDRSGWRALDETSPVIGVDHQACILCDRCIRACDDLQSNNVIGRTGKGFSSQISFDLNSPMGNSTCVSCGECVASCPTGALTQQMISLPVVPREELNAVDSVCPYCGVGCAITFYEQDNRIVFAEGRESPVNDGRLCVKGRYGWDYTSHPQRLTKPLIRREESYPKGPLSSEVKESVSRRAGGLVDYGEVLPAFREATWDEALDLIGEKLSSIKNESGGSALAGFGSAKCSNEEAYLFQKLIRGGFGTNNVDHCTRLCHASSVAALMETIGSGAVTNVFADVARADVCLVTGSNATANHPVAATFIKAAAKAGTKLIIVDVRRHDLADFATHFAQIKPGTDVAFYNGVMHVLISEGLIDQAYIAQHTEDFEKLKELLLAEYSPETASLICGVSAEDITAIARTIGGGGVEGRGLRVERKDSQDPSPLSPRPSPLPAMLVFWGMGISQHTTGTDNARCLISLCLMTGNVGKPGTGLHPLRGQNNVQGASDSGLIPMVYPDYQSVAAPEVRAKFEAAWGRELDPNPGLTVVEIMKAALAGSIRGMYILGENPFISDPNSNKVRKALSALDFLVVQDIFLTETAEFADVILPASSYFEKSGTYTNTDRRVQLGHPVLASPGEARQDWQIICEIAGRLGFPMEYESPAEVFAEFAGLTTSYNGLSHDNLGPTGKLWPCPDPETGDGIQILFGEGFPTASGRGRFVPCPYLPADELPDEEFPFVLNTGRVLEHWHTGSMTRRSFALNSIEPSAFAAMSPRDLDELNIETGDLIEVESRRGAIQLAVRSDDSIEPGCVFVPFHFREAAANVLTTDALDPYGKIPEFKFCAVRVSKAGAVSNQT